MLCTVCSTLISVVYAFSEFFRELLSKHSRRSFFFFHFFGQKSEATGKKCKVGHLADGKHCLIPHASGYKPIILY